MDTPTVCMYVLLGAVEVLYCLLVGFCKGNVYVATSRVGSVDGTVVVFEDKRQESMSETAGVNHTSSKLILNALQLERRAELASTVCYGFLR